MADWNKPALTDLYVNFLVYMKALNTDLAKGLDPAKVSVVNPFADMIRFNGVASRWEIYNGAVWGALSASYDINVSTLGGSAAALYAKLNSPTFTGVPLAPTPDSEANNTQLATTAFVKAALAALVGSSPATLDTLNELATALGNDPAFATTITTALCLKAPLASPALTGTPTAPTAAAGTNTTQLATTAFIVAAIAALKISPAFSGTPTAPTAALGTSTTQIATTEFVAAAINSIPTAVSVPVGAVIYAATALAPAGYLKANGASISRTAYAALFSVIGTTYGAGDGSTTFNLPELRGEFVRGWDDSRNVDSTRVLGSAQSDEVKRHSHGGGFGANNAFRATVSSLTAGTWTASTTLYGGEETRPRNVALLACIKY